MRETLKVEIENVGGLNGRHRFKLKPGLNVVKASNALGKTSFTKALELLILSEEELKNKGHYANLYTGVGDPIGVKISGPMSAERRFMRIGTEKLRAVAGEPLTGEKVGAADICFAVPENQLIISLLSGNPIRDYIEKLSGSKHYDHAVSILDELLDEVKTRLEIFREDVMRLEEAQRLLQREIGEKNELQRKFSKMPIIDEKRIFKDFGEYHKKQVKKTKLEEDLGRNRARLAEIETTIEDLKIRIKDLRAENTRIKKKRPQIQDRLSQISKEIPETEAEFKEIEKGLSIVNDKLKGAAEGILWFSKHPGENVCYTCGRPLTVGQLRKLERNLRKSLNDLGKDRKKISRKLEDFEDEKDILRRELEELASNETEEKQLQESFARREKDKFILEKSAQRLMEDHEKIIAEIKKLSKTEEGYKKYQKREKLRFKIEEKERTIEHMQSRIEELKSKTIDFEKVETRRAFFEEAIKHMKTRKEQIIDVVRRRFNVRINDLYGKMAFRDFERIEITPDYTLHIYRKSKGVAVEDFPLEALATSERVTLAVMLLIASKQEYLPEFPFFVLDELITSYDPTRFKKIQEYIKGISDFVVITELSGEEIAGLKIEHKS